MKTLALDHVHIYATDPDATLDFYEHVLGAERLGSIPASQGRRNHFVILGGQILAVSAYPEGMAPGPTPEVGNGAMQAGYGIAHLGLNVDDLEGYVRRLERAGVDVHGEPTNAGLLKYVYFTAPDGVVVELTQYELPKRYRPAIAALNVMNLTIHRTKRALTKALLRLAPTG